MIFKVSIGKPVLTLSAVLITVITMAQPRATVTEPAKDLGSFHQDETINYDFIVRNEGNAVLQITDVKPSCSCTITEFDKTIEAGKTGKVHAKITLSSFDGPITKLISVSTNDPANPLLTLAITAKVIPWISAKPGFARFLVLQGETNDAVQTSVLVSPEGTPFKILRVESSVPGAAASFHEAAEAQRLPGFNGKQWAVDIKLNNNIKVGPLADYVTVTTDHPHQKEIKIAVSGMVRPMFSINPARIDLGEVTNIKDGEKRVYIRYNNLNGSDVKITEASCSIKAVNVNVKPSANRNEYELTITLDPAISKGIFNGKITAKTSSSFMPVLEIEIKGEVL
jgi:hypothetical protein